MKAISIVRGLGWQQETFETASREAGQRARQLRKLGLTVYVSPMGMQVTSLGSLRLSLVSIYGISADAEFPEVERL